MLTVASLGVPGLSLASQGAASPTGASGSAAEGTASPAAPSLGTVLGEVPRELWRFVSPETADSPSAP